MSLTLFIFFITYVQTPTLFSSVGKDTITRASICSVELQERKFEMLSYTLTLSNKICVLGALIIHGTHILIQI